MWPNTIGILSANSGFQASRSLRFEQTRGTYLSRTLSGAGNQQTWTVSFWAKVTNFSDINAAFITGTYNGSGGNGTGITISNNGGGAFSIQDFNFASLPARNIWIETSAIQRDPTAWAHYVAAIDTTQATASNRVKLYINGVLQTSLINTTYPTLNYSTFMNGTSAPMQFGRYYSFAPTTLPPPSYLAECYFIDGQQLAASSFGVTDPTTGEWNPKTYSGTFGTNGTYLKFSDNSNTTAATLGKDYSGNGNNFTPNSFSVAAGSGNDSLTDTPTNFGNDTGLGGEARGNYCTFSPIDEATAGTKLVITNGGLDVNIGSDSGGAGSFGVTSGKWYWEYVAATGDVAAGIVQNGVSNYKAASSASFVYNAYGYYGINGKIISSSTATAYGSTFTTGDVISVALDMDNGKVWWAKNGTWQNSGVPASGTNAGVTGLTGTWKPYYNSFNFGVTSFNFGQRPFAFTAPTGFKTLCTQNLPVPSIVKSATGFGINLYTGTGSAVTTSGLSFQPDFVWNKGRSAAHDHVVIDSARGATKELYTDGTSVEGTGTAAFTSNGVTSGTNTWWTVNGDTFVQWCWRKGAAYGMDIVTYTGTGALHTVAHSLGAVPQMMIFKDRSVGNRWQVYTATTGAGNVLHLDGTDASAADNGAWNSTAPTSSVFTVNTSAGTNTNGDNYIAYLFASIAGYSSFGTYVGNGSADGPYINCGFRPAFVMTKNTTTGGSGRNWNMFDAARNPQNAVNTVMYANLANADDVNSIFYDFTSSGFKIRATSTQENTSGDTYVYAAFAAAPSKYARAV